MRDARERLRDMQEAITRIERYVAQGRTMFEQDELIQVWVVHHLQIIGEAVVALPAEVHEAAPSIPWRKMIGMRNLLVHHYFAIDREIVWEVAANELPALSAAVRTLLAQLDTQP